MEANCADRNLKEIGLPNGLVNLKDMEEFGYVRERLGLCGLSRRKAQSTNLLVSYAPQVTAQVEFGKIKKSSGVKGKEFFFWVTLGEIYEDDPSNAKITCKNPIGISRSYPPSAL